MNVKSIACLLFFLPLLSKAQKKNKSAMAAAASITAADMKKHLYIIASKEMEGRDTPSPGLEKAASYIEEHFKSLGLMPGNKDSYRQQYPLYKDSALSSTIKVNGISFEMFEDFQPASSNFSAEMRFSEIVFAGYGITDDKRDDYKGLDVTGKLVLIIDGAPADYKPAAVLRGQPAPPSSTTGKMTTASRKGAAAIMLVYNNFPRSQASINNNWSIRGGFMAKQYPFTFNISADVAAAMISEDSKNIFDKVKTGLLSAKIYKAETELNYAKATKTTFVSNVVGMIEGSDKKDEYVFLTSHYDHVGKRGDSIIYYGADDDGSGTTGILELAEAFTKAKAAGKGPRRTIVFMTVSGEEKGLWGSEYYSSHPIFPLEKTSVDLNIDMIGRIGTDYLKEKDSTNYVYIIGDDKLSSDLVTITDKVNSTYTKMKLDRKYNDVNDPNRFYFRSDHYNFAQKGVPIIFYFNGVHSDYHKPTDTPDKINYKLMAKRGQLVFYTAWEMANREEMMKRDIQLEKPKGF
ncbi:MAG: M28 family peptidase [Chitinophagaceae bacterium]